MAKTDTAYSQVNAGLARWNASDEGILINAFANSASGAAGAPVSPVGYAQGLTRYSALVYDFLTYGPGLQGLHVTRYSRREGPKKAEAFVTRNYRIFQQYGITNYEGAAKHITWFAESRGSQDEAALAAGALDYIKRVNPKFKTVAVQEPKKKILWQQHQQPTCRPPRSRISGKA